jgi:TetR/AcrR family transcriptional regulator, cholesterol catabolism regulator
MATNLPTQGKRNSYDDLVVVATRLFSEHGYEGTTVRMIAEALGVKSGSLYSHISTKDEILKKIAAQVADDFLEGSRVALVSEGTAEDRLRAMVHHHLDVVHRRKEAVTVYYDQWRGLDKESRQEINAKRRAYERHFVQVIEEGIEDGTFEPVDVRPAALVLLSSCNWTYQWYNRRGSRKPQEIADSFVELVLTGLRRRD